MTAEPIREHGDSSPLPFTPTPWAAPSTDHDLARYVSGKLGHPIGQTSVGVRRGELRSAGLVADSGHLVRPHPSRTTTSAAPSAATNWTTAGATAMTTEPLVIDTADGMEHFAMCQVIARLRIEVKTGLSHSGGSTLKIAQQRYRVTHRTKKGALEAMLKLYRETYGWEYGTAKEGR